MDDDKNCDINFLIAYAFIRKDSVIIELIFFIRFALKLTIFRLFFYGFILLFNKIL